MSDHAATFGGLDDGELQAFIEFARSAKLDVALELDSQVFRVRLVAGALHVDLVRSVEWAAERERTEPSGAANLRITGPRELVCACIAGSLGLAELLASARVSGDLAALSALSALGSCTPLADVVANPGTYLDHRDRWDFPVERSTTVAAERRDSLWAICQHPDWGA